MSKVALVLVVAVGCGGGGGDGGSADGDGGPGGDAGIEICPDVTGTAVDVPAGFVTDGAFFYYGDDTELIRAPVGGGAPEVIADVPARFGGPLAVGDSHLFFLSDDQAWRVPLAGGVPEPLGDMPGQPVAITSDGTAFYVAAFGDGQIELRRAADPGGSSTLLAAVTTEGVDSLAADGEYLYWLSSQPANVRRVPIGGGTPELVADSTVPEMVAIISGYGIAIAGDEVVWSAAYQSFSDGRVFAIDPDGGERRVVTDRGLTTGFRIHDGIAYVALTGDPESRIAAVPLDGGPRTIAACVADRVFGVVVSSAGLYVRVDGEQQVFPL